MSGKSDSPSSDVTTTKQVPETNTAAVDVNGTDSFGNTQLETAIFNGQTEKVESLLDRHADINRQNSGTGYTPLMYAISNGKTDVASLLIDRGADLNIVNKHGVSALSLAVLRENKDLVKQLVDKGAEITPQKEGAVDPIRAAHNKPDIKKILEEALKARKDKGTEAAVSASVPTAGLEDVESKTSPTTDPGSKPEQPQVDLKGKTTAEPVVNPKTQEKPSRKSKSETISLSSASTQRPQSPAKSSIESDEPTPKYPTEQTRVHTDTPPDTSLQNVKTPSGTETNSQSQQKPQLDLEIGITAVSIEPSSATPKFERAESTASVSSVIDQNPEPLTKTQPQVAVPAQDPKGPPAQSQPERTASFTSSGGESVQTPPTLQATPPRVVYVTRQSQVPIPEAHNSTSSKDIEEDDDKLKRRPLISDLADIKMDKKLLGAAICCALAFAGGGGVATLLFGSVAVGFAMSSVMDDKSPNAKEDRKRLQTNITPSPPDKGKGPQPEISVAKEQEKSASDHSPEVKETAQALQTTLSAPKTQIPTVHNPSSSAKQELSR